MERAPSQLNRLVAQEATAMTINELMFRANHIARTEGSTRPDGSFGPSTWKRHEDWDTAHLDSCDAPMLFGNVTNNATSDQLTAW
jgi:hypothetical protein